MSAIFVAVGSLVAIRTLRVFARNQRLSAFSEFKRLWEASADDRRFVRDEYAFDAENPRSDLVTERRVRRVINDLNAIGMMIESGMLPAGDVLSLCYPDIIRQTYKLRGWIGYEERESGNDYGRRLLRLAERAQNFHDARHADEEIRVYGQATRVNAMTIYSTTAKTGAAGWVQRLNWRRVRMTKRY